MSDPSPSRLKLPKRVPGYSDEELQAFDPTGAKLRLRPRAQVAADDTPAPDAPSGEPVPALVVAPVSFKLPSERVQRRAKRQRDLGWMQLAVTFATLVVGYALGYRHGPLVHPTLPDKIPGMAAPTTTEQADLDTAFAALKAGRPTDARRRFADLLHTHPQWTTLNNQIALASLAEGDRLGFKTFVERGEIAGAIAPADSRTFLAQLSLRTGQYDDADRFLGEAASADPVRAETYYYWGECLLRWGRPDDAIAKFRAAQLRNPYPTAETLCEAQLWVAEVESGRETTDGTAAAIDRALATARPPAPARFAEAARAIKAQRFDQAAEALTRARDVSDPPVYRLMLQDPLFYQERWRHELAPLYREAIVTR